jgi:hypothetical protein
MKALAVRGLVGEASKHLENASATSWTLRTSRSTVGLTREYFPSSTDDEVKDRSHTETARMVRYVRYFKTVPLPLIRIRESPFRRYVTARLRPPSELHNLEPNSFYGHSNPKPHCYERFHHSKGLHFSPEPSAPSAFHWLLAPSVRVVRPYL